LPWGSISCADVKKESFFGDVVWDLMSFK